MAQVNRAAYEAARQRITAGLWTVDAVSGIVIGQWGKPLTDQDRKGYLQATLYEPGKGRIGRVFLHRVIWEHTYGPIPDGVEINHRNGKRDDNRLENLELLTRAGNIQHAHALGLKSMKGSHHPMAKLNEQQVREIRAGHAAGETKRALAKHYGVSASTVDSLLYGESWRHVE